MILGKTGRLLNTVQVFPHFVRINSRYIVNARAGVGAGVGAGGWTDRRLVVD